METVKNTNISTRRWQPSDYKANLSPIHVDRKRVTRKNRLLISVYLILLVGSLYVI
ncbi:MAG: hypothetical protein GY936_01900 [Ignavibacteriae bacterium]|nr:hypothetical protein [Ignavibacteriota bacterium]